MQACGVTDTTVVIQNHCYIFYRAQTSLITVGEEPRLPPVFPGDVRTLSVSSATGTGQHTVSAPRPHLCA